MNSYIEVLFYNIKSNSGKTVASIKSKKAFLNNKNNISFPNSKIQFNSINVDEDEFVVYILYNDKKLQSSDSKSPNCYKINAKDVGVSDNFKELNFTVVNNIKLTI